jgi:hypothetical protein
MAEADIPVVVAKKQVVSKGLCIATEEKKRRGLGRTHGVG